MKLMPALPESIFDICYLSFAIFTGIKLLRIKNTDKRVHLFGAMTLILGLGDSFHLVPRVLNHWIPCNWQTALGVGKLVTSITLSLAPESVALCRCTFVLGHFQKHSFCCHRNSGSYTLGELCQSRQGVQTHVSGHPSFIRVLYSCSSSGRNTSNHGHAHATQDNHVLKGCCKKLIHQAVLTFLFLNCSSSMAAVTMSPITLTIF